MEDNIIQLDKYRIINENEKIPSLIQMITCSTEERLRLYDHYDEKYQNDTLVQEEAQNIYEKFNPKI